MTVDTESEATELAEDALESEGYEDATIVEDPYRERDAWIVRAEHDGDDLNVHIDAEAETVEIADVGEE